MEYVELMSDLTIVLAKDETVLVKINGGFLLIIQLELILFI